ncbi:MAG: 3-dehydroquinate synthase [Bacteroidales bacterium]|nr:3-dehydroquinate synthase [Bacteroidales bacterium]MCK9500055.1 3-dehydroquinate synthase [Bacteroidales bacterium]
MIVKNYKIKNSSSTDIYISQDYNYYLELIGERDLIIITDNILYNLYPEAFKNKKCIVINHGEENKTLKTVEKIIENLIAFGADRNTLILGFGGGMICDITGFVAGVFMRGASFGFVATTLLAQVDAAIGGKNGVNFKNFKNYIGSIIQPEFVVCDANLLKTLPKLDYISGLGEVIKYAFISDLSFFEYLDENSNEILNQNPDILNYILKKCVEIKAKIVEEDSNDFGLRHILNFGHTIGHSIEIMENIPHGIAVAKGIIEEIKISVKLEYADKSLIEIAEKLISKFIPDYKCEIRQEHIDLLVKDKKKSGNMLNFVFLTNIGQPLIVKTDFQDIIKAIKS